jgi:hypothetical protein
VVSSEPLQCQPLFAVNGLDPPIVMTTVQAPEVPVLKLPTLAPPTSVPFEHPEAVN